MDRWEAQFTFWSSFSEDLGMDLPVYEENSVPDLAEIDYPYLTYEAVSARFDESAVVSASIWTFSASWRQADEIAEEMLSILESGDKTVPFETYRSGVPVRNGMIWFTPNQPFAQSMGDPENDKIKRKVLSVTAHFM